MISLSVDDYDLTLLDAWVSASLETADARTPTVEDTVDAPAWLVNANHEEHVCRLRALRARVRTALRDYDTLAAVEAQ